MNSSLSRAAVAGYLIEPAVNTWAKKNRRNGRKNVLLNVSIYSAATLFERLLIKSEKRHNFTVWAFDFSSRHISLSGRAAVKNFNMDVPKLSIYKLVHEGITQFNFPPPFWVLWKTAVAITCFLVNSSFKQMPSFSSREPQRQLWHIY